MAKYTITLEMDSTEISFEIECSKEPTALEVKEAVDLQLREVAQYLISDRCLIVRVLPKFITPEASSASEKFVARTRRRINPQYEQ